jgi:hypothetical protein
VVTIIRVFAFSQESIPGRWQTMDSKNEKAQAKRTDDQGVLAIGIDSIAQATEKTLSAVFGIVRDVRGEISQRVLGVVDWVEGIEQSGIRLARSVIQRTDSVATAWIDANEHLALGVVGALRTTSESATLLASRTAASFTTTRRGDAVAQA